MINKDNKIMHGVKVINVEGKDIQRGFSFLDKNNKLGKHKFKGNFDFSLGLIKLEEICASKDIELYENIDDKLYSKVLVCLNFNYSNANTADEVEKVNLYKQAITNYNINKNYTEIGNAKFHNNKLRKDLLTGKRDITEIRTIRNYINNKNDTEIGSIRFYNNREKSNAINELNHTLTRNGIREDLYDNGFKIDGKTYFRFLRSSGSARVGKCTFILADVYEEMMDYALAGNLVMEDMEIDLCSYEAYLGLVNTALEDIMVIEPKNILLVSDVDSKPYPEKCMVTKLVDGKLHTDIEDYEVSNSLFDGSSLIDYSLLDEKYAIAGGCQLRNKWYKGFSVACSIQKFFENHKITDIAQLNGWTIAEDIKDIKLICTKSSIKYMKVNKGIEGFKKWLNQIDDVWGICGHPHESKFVGGDHVQAHYQLLNNIQLIPFEVEQVAKDSKEYAKLLKNNLEVFKMHIKAEIETELADEENITYDDFSVSKMTDSNKFMNTMIQLDDDFAKTRVFKNYRKETIDNFIKNCKKGHLLIHGCYAVVVSNSIDYLYHAIDKNWEATVEQSHMEHGTITSANFDYNQELLCSRSPMPVQGNILIVKNAENEEIEEYFSYNGKMSKYIMHINVIESNFCERGSGFDNDGDKFLITDNSILRQRAKDNYNKFLVPVNAIETAEDTKITYYWNNHNKAILDEKCSQNNIGRIINDSMILVSEYWHLIHQGETHENLLPLYKIICELSIMSNVAIDACKRPVPYEEEKELTRIENCTYFRDREIIQVKIKDSWTDKKGIEHNKTYKGFNGKRKQSYQKDEDGNYILKDKNAKVRPSFFKMVGQGQEYSFQDFNCSMDYLQKVMKIPNAKGGTDKQLHEFFSSEAETLKTGKAQDRDIKFILGASEIEGVIEKLSSRISAIKCNEKLKSDEKNDEIELAKEEIQQELREMKKGKGISDETLIAIINSYSAE